jgi:choline dehydrogenase-like flavoprotein
MLIDVGELERGARIDADVCVVGGGPTGIALVRELRARSRLTTVLVESGGLRPAPEAAQLNRGQDTGVADAGLFDGRARALGGTSRFWAGQCLPLHPDAFERRSWVPGSGWPLPAAELRPYLARAAEFFEVGGEPYDERVWSPFGLSPLPLDPAKLRHLATVYAPRPDLGARFHSELEQAEDVRVLLRATATRLRTGSGRAATGLLVAGADGREVEVRARAFALCAGAVENARLLLLSGGLGNDADLVGRYFQDHPCARVGTVEAPEPGALLDRYSLLYRQPLRYFPKIGAAPELQRRHQVLDGIANFVFDFGSDSGLEAAKRLYRLRRRGRRAAASVGGDLLRVGRDLPELARAYRRFRRGLSPAGPVERIVLQVHVEQAPDRESRVLLGDELDPLGQPVARVDWRIGDQDVETARVLAAAIGTEVSRLGLGRVEIGEWLGDPQAGRRFSGAYHHLGTTRMSDDPRRGVVDRDCAVHGVAGLYCCGGSVFPAGGAANPTLTMVALAMRLADHLRQR